MLARTAGLFVAAMFVACHFVSDSGGGGGKDAAVLDAPGEAATDGASDAPADSAPPVCDAVKCVTQAGGVCLPSGHCRIARATGAAVACPSGLYCDIVCMGTQLACIDGVDCSAAIGCDITCGAGGSTGSSPGDSACSDGDVRCPANGPCNVTCTGENACRNHGVICGGGRCDVHCLGANACNVGVQCATSTDCHAECQGTNACRDGGVNCSGGTCIVECNGTNACENGKCFGAPTTCEFSCCGTKACNSAMAVCAGCSKDNTCN